MDGKNKAEMMKELAEAVRCHRNDKECLLGFDGYIDELYSVVKCRQSKDEYSRYEKIEDFGKRIMDAAGKSADIEICLSKMQIGGNAPILANALASLGYRTVCIGQMNVDGRDNPFLQMNPLCTRISIGEASRTIAMEFCDGKIMLGDLRGNGSGWQEICEKTGFERLFRVVEKSELVGIVNWGGMYRMNEILDGLLKECLLQINEWCRCEKHIFIDLADPSARSETDMAQLFEMLSKMAGVVKVTLGMNENEACKIGSRFSQRLEGMRQTGNMIREKLALYQLVIHTNQKAFGFREGLIEEYEGMHIERPLRTTGAGDHFNAGFCMGMMENRSLYENLILGQAMASYYIAHGKTANQYELADAIDRYEENTYAAKAV